MAACEKGFKEACQKGPLIGNSFSFYCKQQLDDYNRTKRIGATIIGCRMVVNDGASHSVDSNEMAFRTATIYAFRQGFKAASP
jgi:elongation factor G